MSSLIFTFVVPIYLGVVVVDCEPRQTNRREDGDVEATRNDSRANLINLLSACLIASHSVYRTFWRKTGLNQREVRAWEVRLCQEENYIAVHSSLKVSHLSSQKCLRRANLSFAIAIGVILTSIATYPHKSERPDHKQTLY